MRVSWASRPGKGLFELLGHLVNTWERTIATSMASSSPFSEGAPLEIIGLSMRRPPIRFGHSSEDWRLPRLLPDPAMWSWTIGRDAGASLSVAMRFWGMET